MNYKFCLILVLFVPALIFCTSAPESATTVSQKSENETGPVHHDPYNIEKPNAKWVLPDELKEISGNAWIDKDHLLVIEDLHPNLYLLKLDHDKGTIEKTVPFAQDKGKKFDIEDVTIAGNDVYALWSHGTIYKVTNWLTKPVTNALPTFLTKENNTEGLCFDPVSGNLLVACKNEADLADEKKSTRAVYMFDRTKNELSHDPFMIINKKEFKEKGGEKTDFYPSAIAVQPQSHDLYILSTKGSKVLARFTHDGKLISYQMINADLLPQPEGICFSPDGTMYISSEGKHGAPPVVCTYSYQK